MKRKLLALLLASVMVLSLVACGQKETPDTPETPDDQEEVKDYSGYTIRIYSNSNSTERCLACDSMNSTIQWHL